MLGHFLTIDDSITSMTTHTCAYYISTLNSYALVHEAYTVQIHIPSLYNIFGQLSTPYHYILVGAVCTEHYHLGT